MRATEYCRKKAGMARQKWSKLRRNLAQWNVQVSSGLINLTLVAMLLLSGALVVLAASQVQLSVNGKISGLDKSISDWILSLVIQEQKVASLNPRDKAGLIGSLVSAAGAIVTAVFAVVAWLISHVSNNVRARSAVITTLPVYDENGVDDVGVMIEEYKYANSIKVFGGDFSWMREAHGESEVFTKMRELVTRLNASKKIDFVSYKDERTVRDSIGTDMHNALKAAIIYNAKLKGLRASFIVSPFGRVLIYKVCADSREMHICRVTDRTKDGKELLDQFGLLVENLSLGS